MSQDITAPSSTSRTVRVNLILPEDVDATLEERARTERRSKSAQVAWLIEQDAKKHAAAEAGAVPA